MDTDFIGWLEQQQGRQYELHRQHINPAFVKMLRAIVFDKGYVRGEGCYLWDGEGNKYLDLLTGWGVFALGRNHPKVKAILQQLLAVDSPNLVRMDCSLLAGLVAEKLTSHVSEGVSRGFFCNSGAGTIGAAIKFAPCTPGRGGMDVFAYALPWRTPGAL